MTLSRRYLLTTTAALVATSAHATGFRLRRGRSGVSIPTVAPGAAWNGTALSGGTPPADPTRTTAKPAAQWLQPSELRMSGNIVIGVDADAKGGVAYVDFWVEGTVQRVAQSLYADTDINGKARKRLGYFISLNSAAFNAVSTTGSARIFATAVPNDATMQSRVIGNTLASFNGDRQMTVFPRTTASDFAKTIGASGKDYTTLDAAIVAAKAANAEAAEFTLTDNATYPLTTVATARYSGVKGFHVVKAATGVSATISRAVFPTGANTTWSIEPMFDGLEFRGSGITVDFRNFSTIGNGSMVKPGRFNGCNITNSIADSQSLYWNKGPGPQRGFGIASYIEECTFRYVGDPLSYVLMAHGNNVFDTGGRIFTSTHGSSRNYINRVSIATYRTPVNAMTISYSGIEAATITKTGNSDSGSFLLKINGATVKTYPLGTLTTDTWYDYQAIVNDINAYGSGWAATFQDNSRRASSMLGSGFGSTNGFTDVSVTSTPRQLDAWFDIHSDWFQMFTGGATRSNIVCRGNVMHNVVNNGMTTMFNDAPLQDVVFDSNANYGGGASYYGQGSGHGPFSHFVNRNYYGTESWVYGSANGSDTYCTFEQCVLGSIGTSDPSTVTLFKDNYIYYGFQGSSPWNVAPNSGNTLAAYNSSPAITALVTDGANGDFRAVAPLLGISKARLSPFDGRLEARPLTGPPGPWASGFPAPIWPV